MDSESAGGGAGEAGGRGSIRVSQAILDQFDQAALQHALQYLGKLFGKFSKELIPDQIRDRPRVEWLMRLADALRSVEPCEGFPSHIEQFRGGVSATYPVTLLASQLARRTDTLRFEPDVPGAATKCDIAMEHEATSVLVECKAVVADHAGRYTEEHARLYEAIVPFISLPHRVTIQFRSIPTHEEWKSLGGFLRENLPKVKSSGRLISKDDLEVHVAYRENFNAEGISFRMVGTTQDIHTGLEVPSTHFGDGGKSVCIAGPAVNHRDHVRRRMAAARRQAPDGPYVVAIHTASLLGTQSALITAAATGFTPERNTRIGAVLLFDTRGNRFTSDVVRNPFAKYPIPKWFEQACTSQE